MVRLVAAQYIVNQVRIECDLPAGFLMPRQFSLYESGDDSNIAEGPLQQC